MIKNRKNHEAGLNDMDKSTLSINQAVIKALREEKNGYLNIKALILGFPAEIKKTWF
jgi:hypothetical protein